MAVKRRTTTAVTLGVLAAPMSAALFLGMGIAAAILIGAIEGRQN